MEVQGQANHSIQQTSSNIYISILVLSQPASHQNRASITRKPATQIQTHIITPLPLHSYHFPWEQTRPWPLPPHRPEHYS